MNHTAAQYESTQQRLTAVLDAVPPHRWTDPSPCAGWTARDVLRHVVETQRDLLTGRGIDLGAAPDLDADPASAWREHAKRVLEAICDDAVPATAYDSHFGPTTLGATLEQFYVWDMLVHRWDIARATGGDADLTGDEIGRMEQGADSFGEALYMDGVCQPGVEVPTDADREVRVLARLGRRA